MSYRDPRQSLEEPIDMLVASIDCFRETAENRIRSGEWSTEHLDEVMERVMELTALRYKLLRLAQETW